MTTKLYILAIATIIQLHISIIYICIYQIFRKLVMVMVGLCGLSFASLFSQSPDILGSLYDDGRYCCCCWSFIDVADALTSPSTALGSHRWILAIIMFSQLSVLSAQQFTDPNRVIHFWRQALCLLLLWLFVGFYPLPWSNIAHSSKSSGRVGNYLLPWRP